MNHAERVELISALSRLGVVHYKSHDLEISFDLGPRLSHPVAALNATTATPNLQPTKENDDSTKKLTDLIETLKMDDASLIDKIFPAGAGL